MAYAHVQSASNQIDTIAASLTATLGANLTTGNLVVVSLTTDNTTSVYTVSDTANTYHQIGATQQNAGNAQFYAMFYAWNVTGGVNAVKVTPSSSCAFMRIVVSEYSGIQSASDPLVTSALTNAGTATTAANNATTSTATPTSAGQLVTGSICVVDKTETYTAGTSPNTFTSRVSDASTTGARVNHEDAAAPSTTALAATWTLNAATTGGLEAGIAIFAITGAAAVAAPPTPQRTPLGI